MGKDNLVPFSTLFCTAKTTEDLLNALDAYWSEEEKGSGFSESVEFHLGYMKKPPEKIVKQVCEVFNLDIEAVKR